HTRQQPTSIVHAEKFEPVQFYDHPVFGPTPAYIQPVFNKTQHREENNASGTDTEDDDEVSSLTSASVVQGHHKQERKNSSPIVNNNNNDDDEAESINMPKGYISYKKWKAKYENLIPVNPLLYNIYTHRPNGSLNSYGQSLYAPSNPHLQAATLDLEGLSTPTISDMGSILSDTPGGAPP
ncbi:unnamed protein product, partial [Adineta steineri]